MTAKELAAKLNGRDYGDEMSTVEEQWAKDAGLVVVFGASDDLMEFRGAVNDEVGAYEGARVRVDQEGLVPDFEQIEMERYDTKDKLREYFRREHAGQIVEAHWDAEPEISWSYTSTIPHEVFNVMEDGTIYCKGIVFALADASS